MKIIIVIPYFGPWPPWFHYFLQTCQANPEINWLIYSDSPSPIFSPNNVSFIYGSLKEFSQLVSSKLNLKINLIHPYKICDLRPSFGKIFEDFIQDYDFWGYSDLDLFYGKINHFINKDLLEYYDIISVRRNYFAGHLAFYRNSAMVNSLYKCGYRYKKIFQDTTKHFAYDERLNVFGKDLSGKGKRVKVLDNLKNKVLLFKLWIIKTILNYPVDMTSIIKKALKQKQINYFAEDMVRSDMWFYKKNVSDWKVIWNNGILKDKTNNTEILHFHIIKSKNNKTFNVEKWAATNCFKISKRGIFMDC